MERKKLMKTYTLLLIALIMPLSLCAQTGDEETEVIYPVDMTSQIVNPSFEENGAQGWTNVNMTTQTNSSFGRKNGTTYMEKWVGTNLEVGDARLTQVLTLPAGQYRLLAGAQNINEANTSKRCQGAYIFAGLEQKTVTTAREYFVSFSHVGGQIEIGFVAEGATGNWLAVDNFRLTLEAPLSSEEILALLQELIGQAKELQSSMMSQTASDALNQRIQEAEQLTADSELTAIQSMYDSLADAIQQARTSAGEYASLQTAINEAEGVYEADKIGSEELRSAIDDAIALVSNPNADSADMAAQIDVLAQAVLAFRIANSTATPPTATTHTKFYIPAAHGALMRATFSGTNITERGICWSTEREPTVFDHRATDSYSLNGTVYHIKDMKPSSVYYARAYAINRNYAVGYGEVVKIVTLPQGTCVGTWNEGAPTAEANERCRTAIQQTMDYLNEWTAIKGFRLTGNYGAGTPTADCSYGGSMRIGPNAGNQAIGTVIHETGHGVGVGTHWRWNNCADTRANTTYGKWLGSWANKTLHFLENTESESVFMTGDGVHGWGENATYDWFVNGANKDTHQAIQYIGGCALLYSLYIDGLCPTTGYPNGVPGYTFNFDDTKKYYIRCEDPELGLNDGFICQRSASLISWKSYTYETVSDSAAWYIEYEPVSGYYRFRNAVSGRYMSHSNTASSISLKKTSSPSTTENFQLLPGRKDVTITGETGATFTAPTYWFTWNNSGNKSVQLKAKNELGNGTVGISDFNFSDAGGTSQRFMLISEDQLAASAEAIVVTNIAGVYAHDPAVAPGTWAAGIYSPDGRKLPHTVKGVNIIRNSDGSSRKVYIK